MLDKFDVLESRVNKLEKQNRRLKVGCLASSVIFVCILTMGQAKTGGTTIEAQSFVLKSANGEVWGELSSDGDYAHFNLRSPNGQKEVHISPIGVSVLDNPGPNTLPLAYYGGQGLYLTDGHGDVVVEVGGAQAERLQLFPAPEIKIFNPKGGTLWHAP